MKVRLRYIAFSFALTACFVAGRASVEIPPYAYEIEEIRIAGLDSPALKLPVRK
jgi:hypothetical protein